MRSRSPRCLTLPRAALAVCCCAPLLLGTGARAQLNPFGVPHSGPGLSPEDNRLLFESVNRLNTAEPIQIGRSETWSNPKTHSSGTATVLRVFRSGGQACHLVRYHLIVAGRRPGRDYRVTWCRTPGGEWRIKE
jgi:surface antigen